MTFQFEIAVLCGSCSFWASLSNESRFNPVSGEIRGPGCFSCWDFPLSRDSRRRWGEVGRPGACHKSQAALSVLKAWLHTVALLLGGWPGTMSITLCLSPANSPVPRMREKLFRGVYEAVPLRSTVFTIPHQFCHQWTVTHMSHSILSVRSLMTKSTDVIHLNKDRLCALLASAVPPLPLNGCVIQMEAHMLPRIFHSRLSPQESTQHIPADDLTHFQDPNIYIQAKTPTSRHELNGQYGYTMGRVCLWRYGLP